MKLFVIALSFLLTIVSCSFIPDQTWENVEFKRTIDLSKSYSKEILSLTIKNIDSKPNSEYYYALPNYVYDRLSIFVFSGPNGQQALSTSLIEESTNVNNEPLINYIKVNLPKPIAPNQSFKLNVNLAVTDSIEPYPKSLELTDEQTLLLKTNKLPISAYKTLSGSSLSIAGIPDGQELESEGKTNLYKGSVKDKKLVYEFDEEIEPFKFTVLNLLYRHNLPLTKITKLERGIWISHWANSLQVEEFYKLTNKGASLKNGFSRSDYMLNKQAFKQTSAIAAAQLDLLEEARDVYYTDLVGNVSTSKVMGDKLYIKPRYPIFGGWNYNFTIGWTNSLRDYLRPNGLKDEYILSLPFINGPVDSSYDEVELSFYLPEGSKILDIVSPIPYDSKLEGYELSYFDLSNGHTKVTLTYSNVIDDLSHLNVLIKYEYSFWNFIKKALDIAKFVFIALISYLALTKIDVSLKAKN
ncbi:Dolichyl-diphosphooligosaccharide protein glycosyltransferase subunit 1 [Wickerhamomyces ciferrii]|uniref:Dolichyl-diphosphooligosaccharide--protein glycosyltransferase subunit 1 n=1 Tax=Wickerhamomyces ciferrii (strain ATCC 14091 / BCRC 22168 / CBS 111 / JCM 3599 / NBRC 0793 / NRRL Y-1031 F-60-10) TaxID=1206466 RepID=K0KP02_WICCF|nr:Dolichyl-diphosphooligosaccharide protein glycosyltransferase subunit 1 [Wickerhamomyces ciferrii]CCH43124.1 Dolichyl-diphosphooligosaccharide protein glycosyltransferase subunit 1 [Wickerhamomyces ciferrii]